ncbi:MAG: thioredoxin domain-containing protein, partial [Chloroflexi bacterium]|nr:thioredoxin domain-containing protein [Chloroflexota bacterium]
FARAAAEDKPIFLSIGYSACHWCHVMEHESFEDPETAALMNEHYINIKVDREERPDVDAIYMNAVQALTGSGGWPMSVFLMPDGRPFYGGTYFPKEPRYGMPSFRQVLTQLAAVYRENRGDVEENAARLTEAISGRLSLVKSDGAAAYDGALDIVFQGIAQTFEPEWGGFGTAPKFPPAMTIELLLRMAHRKGWQRALDMATFTLDKMMRGGMYDQLGGGFHRYSVDDRWLVPHFEKMLYDNALLMRAYLYGWQMTGSADYRRIVEEIAAYVRREMTSPEGGFYSTQDADSEGEEGKFFVWSEAELRAALAAEVNHLDAVLDYWAVEEGGNFEGHSILWVPDAPADVAERNNLSLEDLLAEVAKAREILFTLREQRVKPGRDEKILTAWNGLMIVSLAQAARALDDMQLLRMAMDAADFVVGHLMVDGRLRRSHKDGQAKFNAYLEDYAFLAEGLLELYQTTFDLRWFRQALALTEAMVELFWDEDAGFYDTSHDHEELVARPQDVTDNATPAGNSAAVAVLVRMAILANRPEWAARADRLLRHLARPIQGYPRAFGYLASQLDFVLSEPQEIALVGSLTEVGPLLAVVREGFRPNQVVALLDPDEPEAAELIPLLNDRPRVEGRATAYVCRNYACKLPVTDPEALRKQLQP